MASLSRSWRPTDPGIQVGVLAAGHGLNDFTAGTLLGSLVNDAPGPLLLGGGFLLYNALAFGGQYAVARWLQRGQRPMQAARIAALLNLLALPLHFLHPLCGLLLSGTASALYHVAGGTLCAGRAKAADLGWFAAPGIIGLAAAGYLAYAGVVLWWPLALMCALFGLLLQRMPAGMAPAANLHAPAPHGPDRHDGLMVLLLALIAFRSALWNIFQLVEAEEWTALGCLALSAFAGKIAGGYLADRIGWQRYQAVSLSVAAPLLHFFREELWLLCLGIGLLQSGIPASTALLVRRRGGAEGTALSLGVAVMAGVLLTAPYYLFPLPAVTALLLLSIFLLLLLHQRRSFTRA